jgi:hypothetical protein
VSQFTSRSPVVPVVATVRLGGAALGVTAITASFFDTASRETVNPFNFFGFFTMQSNIILAVVLAVTAVVSLAGRTQSPTLQLARACGTTYIVVVGIVYNTLLANIPGGVSLEWANTILHVVMPIYAALDWFVVGDRTPLPWSRLWIVTIYPVLWIAVVLIRGATDGWVPYPFLDPLTGYVSVTVYCIAIAAGTVVAAAVIWAASRWRVLALPAA